MDLALLIYLIDVFCGSSGGNGFAFLGGIGLIAWAVGMVVATICKADIKHDGTIADDAKAYLSTYKSLWPAKAVAVLCLLIAIFVPSKEAAYTMVAAYGLQQVATNERVQEIGGKSLDVLEAYMDEFLEEKAK